MRDYRPSLLLETVPALSRRSDTAYLNTSAASLEGTGPDAKNSPEQKKGVRTDPDIAPPKDDRLSTPSSKKTNELVSRPYCYSGRGKALHGLHTSTMESKHCAAHVYLYAKSKNPTSICL